MSILGGVKAVAYWFCGVLCMSRSEREQPTKWRSVVTQQQYTLLSRLTLPHLDKFELQVVVSFPELPVRSKRIGTFFPPVLEMKCIPSQNFEYLWILFSINVSLHGDLRVFGPRWPPEVTPVVI